MVNNYYVDHLCDSLFVHMSFLKEGKTTLEKSKESESYVSVRESETNLQDNKRTYHEPKLSLRRSKSHYPSV